VVEPLAARRVLATITGVVFDDLNASTRQDAEESGLEERLVFLDSNDDGLFGAGEPYQLTDADGRFTFAELGLGDHTVRLFNGTSSQHQTVPFDPQWDGSIELAEGQLSAVSLDDSHLYVLQQQTLVAWDLEQGGGQSLTLPAAVTSLHPLPDGSLIALGTADAGLSGDAAWRIDFAGAGTIEAIDLGLQAGETGWSSLALDGEGRGVLLAARGDQLAAPIRQVQWVDNAPQVAISSHSVVSGATAVSDPHAVTSLIAVPQENGLSLTPWSNVTASPIDGHSTLVPQGVQLLAYDEASNLAVVETADGDLLLLDSGADFALLEQFDDLHQPVALDGPRQRLLAIDDAGDLAIQDLVDASLRQSTPLDSAAVGGLALVEGGKAVFAGQAEQLRRLRLDRPGAFRVRLRQGEESADVFFGLFVEGENQPPVYASDAAFWLDEDTTLQLAAPGLLVPGSDPDAGDRFVVLPNGDPHFGSAQTSPAGALRYEPVANANGTDQLPILLHDGRALSEPATVDLHVRPVDDPIGPATFVGTPVPENFPAGQPLGIIQIVNPDVDEAVNIEINNDDRFQLDGNQLILAEGVNLDFELEPTIFLEVVIHDELSGEQAGIETVQLQVSDVPEAIVDIHMYQQQTVAEGIYGEQWLDGSLHVGSFYVEDLDLEGDYGFELSDPRFEIVDRELRIVPDSEFDFEQEPTIDLTIRAYELENPFEFSKTFTINIGDVNELPTTASFQATEIIERVVGATVGDVIVDDPDQPSTVHFSVDDSRFEFDGPTLKLRDGVFVERGQQEQIELTLTVADYAGESFVQTLDVSLDVLENANPFHNEGMPGDVDGDDQILPIDALLIINFLNRYGPGPVEEAVNSGHAEYFYDVNNDGLIYPLDALLVINALNRNQQQGTSPPTVGGEGEDLPDAPPPAGPSQPIDDSLSPLGATPELPETDDETPADQADPLDDPLSPMLASDRALIDWSLLDNKPAARDVYEPDDYPEG